jgi:hypothetical protein
MPSIPSWLRPYFRGEQNVEFASTARVLAHPELHDDFIKRVLGFRRDDPVFISDESTLGHFGDAEHVAVLRQRIRAIYGVDAGRPPDALICDILERIARNGSGAKRGEVKTRRARQGRGARPAARRSSRRTRAHHAPGGPASARAAEGTI